METDLDIRVGGVPAPYLEDVWGQIEPFVEGACDWAAGEMTADDVKLAIENRQLQLWIAGNSTKLLAAFTTELVTYPQFRAVRIKHYGGLMNELILKKAWELLRPWAKAHGCERLEAIGRPGWERMAGKVLPVKKTYTVIHGEIE